MNKDFNVVCQKERYTKAELRTYFGSTNKFEISGKELFYFVLVSICIVCIFPFIPPKHQSNNWTFPQGLDEYLSEVKFFLKGYILVCIYLGLTLILENNRRKLDKYLGYKFVLTQEITSVINLPGRKLLILNGWMPFVLKERRLYFQTVKYGQIMRSIRTGTFKLLSYTIYED